MGDKVSEINPLFGDLMDQGIWQKTADTHAAVTTAAIDNASEIDQGIRQKAADTHAAVTTAAKDKMSEIDQGIRQKAADTRTAVAAAATEKAQGFATMLTGKRGGA